MPRTIASLIDMILALERRREMPPFRPDEVQHVVLTTADLIIIIEPQVATITPT